jgi:hypothetical protein
MLCQLSYTFREGTWQDSNLRPFEGTVAFATGETLQYLRLSRHRHRFDFLIAHMRTRDLFDRAPTYSLLCHTQQ